MYFWKIEKFKEAIITGRMKPKDLWLYCIAYILTYSGLLVYTLVGLFSQGYWGIATLQIVLVMAGTYYAYYQNKKAFNTFYFCGIAWMVLVRTSFFMAMGMLNLYVMSHLFDVVYLVDFRNTAIIACGFELLFYWRIAKHLSDF